MSYTIILSESLTFIKNSNQNPYTDYVNNLMHFLASVSSFPTNFTVPDHNLAKS